MRIAILALFAAILLPLRLFAQPLSHQNWQSATIVSDTLTISCADLRLPFERGSLLSEQNPTTSRGDMDFTLRSGHPVKVIVSPETSTSDTISSISGCTVNGARVQLATAASGQTITVAHTPGAIEFSGSTNVVLSNPLQVLTLQRKAGIWVADGGLGGGGGGSAAVLEDLTTSCTLGEVGISDGAGQVNCGPSLVEQSDCSTVTGLGQLCFSTFDGHVYRGDGVLSHRISAIHQAADCASFSNIGELCIDTDDGLVYRGDDEEASVIGGGAAGTQSLQDAFTFGKVISGANSQANAMVIGNGTDGFRIYNNIIECFQGASTCDIDLNIPSGNSLRIKYNGTEGIVINSSGQVTLNNALVEYKSYSFGAGTISTDGTNCLDPVEKVINGGPKQWVINCGDNAGSIIYGSVTMRDAYSGGPIFFLLEAENENAAPSGVLDFDFSAMCRGDGDKIYDPSTAPWGAAMPVAITFTAQYNAEMFWTGAVTPHGTCQAGDKIFWRAVMDATGTTTQAANTYILGVKMEYPTNKWSD